ncbi:MAG: amino acid permease [Acidobacteria bacterium]|nr:amino acid permease [Acidobacteriota bacterium]
MKRIGLFDTTMIVMGGIIGSGIFINPYVVARQLNTPELILGAWIAGGIVALLGAFIYSELASRLPDVGGQYAYLRDAFHPIVAFIYGWTLLLVIQTGGMAAVAMTFARYFIEITGLSIKEGVIAVLTLVFLTIINCLGLRAGSLVQSILMVLKILAILALIIFGLVLESPTSKLISSSSQVQSPNTILAFATAMVPVLFAYGGWQTASFISGEVDNVRKTLPRALIIGVLAVVLLYLGVNYVCLSVLGAEGLAKSTTPASAIMTNLLGEKGARLIAIAITISTLGFLSQSMLTAPRVYFAMARDKVFFQKVGWLDPNRNVPTIAILLQGLFASIISLSGQYEQILNYVVSTDFVFYGLVALCLFRLRQKQNNKSEDIYKMPLHPYSTMIFMLTCWIIVLSTIYKYPLNSLIGIGIMLLAIPVYFFWKGKESAK